MKRILLGLFLLLGSISPASAAVFVCTPSTSCDGADEVCDWDTAATWLTCNSTYPHNTGGNTYSANITGSGTIMIDGSAVNPTTIGSPGAVPLTIAVGATLAFRDDNCAAGCDARQYRHLTIVAPASPTKAITLNGRLVMRAHHRINCDDAAGPCAFFYDDGAVLDVSGTTHTTTVTGWSEADADTGATGVGTCRVSDTKGRRITIAVADGIGQAKQGRRIVFESGQLRNRHFEIVAVGTAPDRSITFCTDYDDVKSANADCTALSTPWATCTGDATGTTVAGQRLTPHVAAGVFPNERHLVPSYDPNTDICTGAGAPFRCCTGAGAGSCYTDHCVASGVPDSCCTGPGTGTCGIRPAIGDTVTILNDGMFTSIAGTNGWGWAGQALGNDPAPSVTATNMAHCGYATDGHCFSVIAKADGQDGRAFLYNNVHDWAGEAPNLRGVENQLFRWTAVHDSTSTTINAGTVIWQTGTGLGAEGALITDNWFYRNAGNAMTLGVSGNARMDRNLVSEGCTKSNECNGLESNSACENCSMAYNLVHDIRRLDGATSAGDCYHLDASNPDSLAGSYAAFNWGVNCTQAGGSTIAGSPAWSQVGWTHNYFSHLGTDGIQGGSAYSNVIRNYGAASLAGSRNGLSTPYRAKGNFIHGNDASFKAGASCGATDCADAGIFWTTAATTNPSNLAVVASDNIIKELDVASNGFGVSIGGTDTYDITVDHHTFDGGGFFMRGLRHNAAPASAMTLNVDDVVGLRLNNQVVVLCTADANTTDNIGTVARMISPYTADDTLLATSGVCSSGPTSTPTFGDFPYVSVATDDYSLPTATSLVTAGTSPPIGARAFRFERKRFEDVWGRLPFDGGLPKSFANGSASNNDTDKDGVMDLHDNCDVNFNPSQLDTDGDGAGDACDP